MPAYRVAEANIDLALFDVVGLAGDVATFIKHVGLTGSAGRHSADRVPVVDMAPPLHGQDEYGHMKADVIGNAVLTDDDRRKIATFVDRHAGEHEAFRQLGGFALLSTFPRIYIVYPHMKPFHEEDGRYARMRFSCAGFVLEAYRRARIRLLEPEALPPVEMDIIQLCYPQLASLMKSGRVSPEDLGLEGDGPWPVLLCGYLFHALNRDAAAVRSEPYAPKIEDRCFG